MALKDLVAEKGALDEAAIERIVGPYVRYDIEAQEVTFMPAFASLANKAKILVYLVALQGWKFVTDEPMDADARPSDIEAATGIPGGSLRPTLRGLCDAHLLTERDSRYSVRGTTFPLIEAELTGGGDDGGFVRRARPPVRKGRKGRVTAGEGQVEVGIDDEGDVEPDQVEQAEVGVKSRKVSAKTGNVAATFDRWIDEGYFNEPRTLSEVQKKFRQVAIMVPQTSLPGYFLSAVRKGRLTREELEVNGKTVWAYTASNAAKAK